MIPVFQSLVVTRHDLVDFDRECPNSNFFVCHEFVRYRRSGHVIDTSKPKHLWYLRNEVKIFTAHYYGSFGYDLTCYWNCGDRSQWPYVRVKPEAWIIESNDCNFSALKVKKGKARNIERKQWQKNKQQHQEQQLPQTDRNHGFCMIGRWVRPSSNQN